MAGTRRFPNQSSDEKEDKIIGGADNKALLSNVFARPAEVLDTSEFVDWCRRDKPRTYDYIHRCDILPIIIGSELDRRIRQDFWGADRSIWCEDELKIGLLIQNKNFYNFTITMATNPKVAHIYRRSNKLHCLDSRVYYYDNNFRGNMFYFEQSLLLIKCIACLSASTEENNSSRHKSVCQGPMCIVVEELFLRNCFKQDHLLVRRFCCVSSGCHEKKAPKTPAALNDSGQNTHTHDAAVSVILRYFQQRDKHGENRFVSQSNACSPTGGAPSLTEVLDCFGECESLFSRFASSAHISDVLFEEDLASYSALCKRQHNENASVKMPTKCQRIASQDRIHIRLTNEKDLTSLLFCDLSANDLNSDFISSVLKNNRGNSDFSDHLPDDPKTFWRIDNMDEFRRISDSCFPKWTTGVEDLFSLGAHYGYYDQLFVLYSYMREVMLRNEDIDQLCNKCVFDGSYLYNKLMRQMREYLCHRFLAQDLNSDWIDTLVSRYRALAHTANLYMLISSKTNIRVDMANDLKRSLKLSIKREKMQQTDYSMAINSADIRDNGNANMSSLITLPSTSSSTAKLPFGRQAICPQAAIEPSVANMATLSPLAKRRRLSDDWSPQDVSSAAAADRKDLLAPAIDLETNDKCDFVLKRGHSSKFRHLYTGNYSNRQKATIIVASCNIGDINARQLITYDSQHLLQNVASAHFTDLEFVFEQVKRPRVTNQQNSSKCALMPRQSTRFLSAYNIGNMSVAGRTMNVCARNSITFFVRQHRELSGQYYQWLSCVYSRLTVNKPSYMCFAHHLIKCNQCFLRFMINEVPCANFLIDKYYEFTLFVLTKAFWPAVQFYRKTSHIINVTLISGVIMIPMQMVLDDESVVRIDSSSPQSLRYDCWLFCALCRLYFPRFALDRSSNLFFIDSIRSVTLRTFRRQYFNEHCSFLLEDGGLTRCASHTWFSSNDMQYYESMLAVLSFSGLNEDLAFYIRSLNEPFFYEVACHGLFLNNKFVDATDISKLTVSINASKRRLRLRGSMFSDRLETLMDQNARMYVDDKSVSVLSSDGFEEPLQNIIGVAGQNSFRCCFMFGDFRGRNCEDAYVFDSGSRPRLVNTIQLKVNYYRQDNTAMDTSGLRFHFLPSVDVHPGCGCTFFFGYLISPCRLSFGSTFVHVKTVRSSGLWIYKFYYTNWSSYLRDGEMIFASNHSDKQTGGCQYDGLRFERVGALSRACRHRHFFKDKPAPRITFDPRIVCDVTNNPLPRKKKNSTDITTLSGVNRILCEHACVTANGRIHIEMQMTSRQLRFVVTLRDIYAIQKLQNNCGQKGVTSYEDLSDLYTSRGGRVHVIVSLYSMNGRQLLSQLLEQYSNAGTAYSYRDSLPIMAVYSKQQGGRQVGFAGYGEFFFSCDSPHDNIIVSSPNFGNNAMRMCNMTYFAAIGNNLSTWIANRSADHVNYRNNPVNGMPLNVYHCLSVYHYYGRQLYPRALLTRQARKRFRDWVEMQRRGVNARLPLSLHFSYTKPQNSDVGCAR